jgi:hypothetical protein
VDRLLVCNSPWVVCHSDPESGMVGSGHFGFGLYPARVGTVLGFCSYVFLYQRRSVPIDVKIWQNGHDKALTVIWSSRRTGRPAPRTFPELSEDSRTASATRTKLIVIAHRKYPSWILAERRAPIALGSISGFSCAIRNRSGWAIGRRGYGRPPRPRAEIPTICHTSCHTELDVVGKESVSH